MNVERRLKELLSALVEEVRQNPEFAARLAVVFGDEATQRESPRSGHPREGGATVRRGNRRAAALVHPLTEIAQGEANLRARLAALDLEQLRDVVAEYGMDPNRLVMKWKDRERVVDHILATAVSRARKGDAFRA